MKTILTKVKNALWVIRYFAVQLWYVITYRLWNRVSVKSVQQDVNGWLSTRLTDWTDFDTAALILGKCLGLFPSDTVLYQVKGVFWTNNTLGNVLYNMLQELVTIGALEYDGDEQRFRWNPNFVPRSR